MKKVVIVIAMMFASITAFSQSVFDKFEDLDGVTSVILNQKMFKMLATMATVNRYLKSSDLEELMRIKDGDQTVKFYVKEGRDDNHVKELLMYISGLKEMTKGSNIEINGEKREFETVVMTLTGDIDLRQVSKITNQMDIPGGEQLKKAGQKN